MSQDLFAEFSADPTPQPGNIQATSSDDLGGLNAWTDAPKSTLATISGSLTKDLSNEEEDDFGDFEDAEQAPAWDIASSLPPSQNQPKKVSAVTAQRADAVQLAVKDPMPPKTSAVKKVPLAAQQQTGSIPQPSFSSTKPTQPKGLPFKPKEHDNDKWIQGTNKHPFADQMDVLFAADEDEYTAGADEWNDLSNDPAAAMAYSKKVIGDQQRQEMWKNELNKSANTSNAPVAAPSERNKLRKKSGYAPARDPDVLFDANDPGDDEDDDFGDFEISGKQAEATTPSGTTKNAMPAIDLLGLDDEPSSSAATSIDPYSHDLRSTKTELNSQILSGPNKTVSQPVEEDESWDDFTEAAPKSTAITEPPVPLPTIMQFARPSEAQTVEQLPPTNVPPPSVLLSLFPSMLASAQSSLFQPLATLSFTQKQQLLAHPATPSFLRGFLALGVVLARIIAGRKLRWKRDQFLAQSMRIGPAAAGGKGGMKLAGVDKAEVAKEDREVLDVVRSWKAQVGKLRSAVAGANAAAHDGKGKLPAVPEIGETMPIKMLKPAEGGLTAAHACALCGLKREERVAKVDESVEDSFGEWWVEGMSMHTSCRNLWDEQKKSLRSR